ncbi:MAG: aminoacyl-tRNA hydrolase [Bacilli bacterium]
MKLIVGLGNPGDEYRQTRHNMGFMVVDALAKHWRLPSFKHQFHGEVAVSSPTSVVLLKPITFMNLSGQAVQACMQFYKIHPQDVVIIYDDLALEPGRIRLRMGGSSGSHNGMQHVIDTLQTQDIKRIRVGIGAVPVEQKGKDYVLGMPSASDHTLIQNAIADVVKAIEVYLASDFSQAMNRFNRGGSD